MFPGSSESTMLVETLATRSVHFALLFGPPRSVTRAEASKLYDRICDALRLDDFAFKYTTQTHDQSPQSKGFSIQLERKEGRGAFGVTIDNENVQRPIRLLLLYTWPPTLEHVRDQFDLVAENVFDVLEGDWQKVHAEVRLRAQCGVRDGGALGFLRQEMVKLPSDWIDSLGKALRFMSLRFDTASAPPVESSLDAPGRQLSVEPLREDPNSLYFELVCTWKQIPDVGVSPGTVDIDSLRPIDAKPSEYVSSAHEFLDDRLRRLSSLGRADS